METLILDIEQGSQEWLEARLDYLCASEAPAMMNQSKHMSRNALLDLKKGWQSNPVSKFTQKLFDDGHEYEDAARTVLEIETLIDYPPVVAVASVEGLELLASFDGLPDEIEQVWEHKTWNETLALNINNQVLEPHHYWQLEHQSLVSERDEVLFTCSDGTASKKASMIYTSVPERRAELIAGWHQFLNDLNNHQLSAKAEPIKAKETESFPLIKCSVDGSMVVSNLGEYIPLIKELANEQMSLVLETDQDFADKEAFNKKVKESRKALKDKASSIESTFSSLADFNGFVKEADGILQKLQSHGEKQVKESKEAKKRAFVVDAKELIANFITEINESFGFPYIPIDGTNWAEELKGKRNFESMKNAIDSAIAKVKIEITKLATLIRINRDHLDNVESQYKALFADHARIVFKDLDDVKNLIESRINTHKAEEAARLEREREQIRREEEAKAKRAAQAELDKKEALRREKARVEQAAEFAEREKATQHKKMTEAVAVEDEPIPEVKANEIKKPLPVSDSLEKPATKERKTKPTQPVIIASPSNDGEGYSLYANGEYVGYIESAAFIDSEIVICKHARSHTEAG